MMTTGWLPTRREAKRLKKALTATGGFGKVWVESENPRVLGGTIRRRSRVHATKKGEVRHDDRNIQSNPSQW